VPRHSGVNVAGIDPGRSCAKSNVTKTDEDLRIGLIRRGGRALAPTGGMTLSSSDRGFTLFETLIATGILVTALAGVAQLFVLGGQLAKKSSASGVALLAAQNKLELLRGLTFGFDANGNVQTAPDLEPSPERSLNENMSPFLEWLDSSGEVQDEQEGAAFVRRWRIARLDAQTPDVITIEVCVFPATAGEEASSADACLSTLRTRQP
jgi:type II secretory pathway pseudopilin PulG